MFRDVGPLQNGLEIPEVNYVVVYSWKKNVHASGHELLGKPRKPQSLCIDRAHCPLGNDQVIKVLRCQNGCCQRD